jgi:GNAT superfamily N-acetyltransferase
MITVRPIEHHERERVLDLLGEWISREFFRRYFEHDPAFRDELCLVAEEDGRLVSTLQIIPKTVRIGGRDLRVGGIGNVFTSESHRHRGVASRVLRRAVEVMEREGFDLSLLFASRLTFYAQFGWASHRRLLAALVPPSESRPAAPGIRAFDPRRDLDAVMAVHDEYSHARGGAVVRDRDYWWGQLRYAGNPGETFLVTERGGRVAAYARVVDLYGIYTVMEHGAVSEARDALLDLLDAAGETARDRGLLLLHLGAEPDLKDDLSARGFGVTEVEDVFWMWRVVCPESVAAKLGLTAAEVGAPDLFDRLLPLRGSVYWTSDRF